MKNEIIKKSTSNVEIKSDLAFNVWVQNAFFHPIRIELNNHAKILLILFYTALVVFSTLGITHLSTKYELNENALNLKELNRSDLFREAEMATVKIDSSQLAYANKLLVQQVNSEILKSLDDREKNRIHIIQSKDEKIQLLNGRIEKLLLQLSAKNELNKEQNKITVYSIENEDVLRREQEMVEREFKNNQKIQKEAYMGLLDLTNSADQKNFQAYLNKQQLELYKIQKAFEKERREFRTKTFRVANSKTTEDYLKLLEE